jgi:hypothetical protein
MASPVKINFKMYQGSTFREVLRWESASKGYAPITGITKSAPVQITVKNNEIPEGWRVKIYGVNGMKEINNTEQYYIVEGVIDNGLNSSGEYIKTLTLDINSAAYSTYTSGGFAEYNRPVNLTGYTARMQLRAKLDSNTVITELTTVNNGVIIGLDKTITLTIPATVTAGFNFNTAVYSLELLKSTEVITFATGNITLVKEVTR